MHPMFLILAIICAFILGALIGFNLKEMEESVIGTFILDTDPNAPNVFELRFDKDLDEFSKKKYVTFLLKKK